MMKTMITAVFICTLLIFVGCISTENQLNQESSNIQTNTRVHSATSVEGSSDDDSVLGTPTTIANDLHEPTTIISTPTALVNDVQETPTAINTATLLGNLAIFSEPPGALLTIQGLNIEDITPYTVTLDPGFYTLTLSLENHNIWTDTIHVDVGQLSSIQANLVDKYQYVSVQHVNTTNFLEYVGWEAESNSLIYAVQGDLQLNNIPSFESKDWIWWQYDVSSHNLKQIASPDSGVIDSTRQALNLCSRQETKQTPCGGYSILIESMEADQIVFTPVTTGEGSTWLANLDGSNIIQVEEIESAPAYAKWSSDGNWLIIGTFTPLTVGGYEHYLVASDGSFVSKIGEMTNTNYKLVTGIFPEFSPDGRKVAFVGTENEDIQDEESYNLYVLDLDTFQIQTSGNRFGLFQWTPDSDGLYILDNAVFPLKMDEHLWEKRISSLYFINVTGNSPIEHIIADNIVYYPKNGLGTWLWAYSPRNNAIAGGFLTPQEELGILFLEKP